MDLPDATCFPMSDIKIGITSGRFHTEIRAECTHCHVKQKAPLSVYLPLWLCVRYWRSNWKVELAELWESICD